MSEQKQNENNKTLSATGVVKLAEKAAVKLFHTAEREPYVSFYTKRHWETWPVQCPEFEHWLSAMCYHETGLVPGQSILAAAMTALAGHALYGSPEKTVYVRIAEHNEAIYLDLGNDGWEAVKITHKGWEITADVPVKFRRASGMLPLPRPIAGGRMYDLRSFLNCDDEEQWILIVSWLVGAFRPIGPFPLLIFEGNHGSAKTMSAKLLLSLVDPNISPLRAAPTSQRDLAIRANNSWCVGLDNLSSMPHWLSDAFCRLSTGGGFSTRALYTNSGEKIFAGTRPVLINGIDIGIDRGDFLDRSIRLELPPISEERREMEKKLLDRFEASRPFILGNLLDAVACSLRRLPEIEETKLPRMADFATWVCAAEPALGWGEGSFLKAYGRNREDLNSLALEASELVPHQLNSLRC